MEDNKKKKSNIFKYVCYFLLSLFACLMIINKSGYTSLLKAKKTIYTEEQIEKFESALKSGENIDKSQFIEYDDIDYSNTFSDLGVEISTLIDKGSTFIFNFLVHFFEILFK